MSPDIPEHVILRQPPEAQAIIRALMAQVTELKSEVIRLKAEVAALKLELGRQNRSPQNSSLPPSTQHPHARPASPRRKSKKKRGGQPGHTRHERALIPAEECHEVVTLKPEQCRRCGTSLTGHDESPLRHQVWELPE
jgi:transposase